MSCVCIITALAAESRPFIDGLALRHQADPVLRLYAGDHFLLLQTGMGKLKAAAHTAALLHSRSDICAVINVGLAGGSGDIGSLHIAHEVRDTATGERWYPHLPPQRIVDKLPSTALHTVDNPASHYLDGLLFDMEAAGIFSAASPYLANDLVNSIKLLSDNSDESRQAINPSLATELLQTAVPVVSKLGYWLLERQQDDEFSLRVELSFNKLTYDTHHSTTEGHALRRLLQRYYSINTELSDNDPVYALKQAKKISRHLKNTLAASPLSYGEN